MISFTINCIFLACWLHRGCSCAGSKRIREIFNKLYKKIGFLEQVRGKFISVCGRFGYYLNELPHIPLTIYLSNLEFVWFNQTIFSISMFTGSWGFFRKQKVSQLISIGNFQNTQISCFKSQFRENGYLLGCDGDRDGT